MYTKCKQERRNRKINLLQNKLDTHNNKKRVEKCPICHNRTDGIISVPIYFVEDKLNEFILFLEKDKKRFKNLNKSKFDFLNKIVKRNIK